MKALTLIPLLSLTLVWSAMSQTTNISGVVNSYYNVTEILPSGGGVRTGSTAGLSLYDMVMVIQMKGASVITSNNSSYGDTTALNNAGNYEIGVVCGISGDSVFLFHSLVNNYSVANKVQLVRIPEYYAANVTDTLKATVWNNASGVGGVLAIAVATDLTLNAPIYADSAGFNGGDHIQDNGTCSNLSGTGYYYNGYVLTQWGALKGEGVYEFPTAQSGGRGAPANGGGGGNNHNNGGGGGANLTNGGIGGGNFSTTGCKTTLRGLAGKSLSSWGGSKLFLGGGGGAGHSNYALADTTGGGNGGGIVFIIADNIIGNNQKISANGTAGGKALSDGASGGGAGGSIILNVATFTGNLTVLAKGGKGGDERDDGLNQRCYGAGGGGSGGVVYYSGAATATTTTTTGGIAGINISSVNCGTPQMPDPGASGLVVNNYSFTASLTPGTNCSGVLPVRLIYFKANLDNQAHVQLRWQVANPDEIDAFSLERSTDLYTWNSITRIAGSDNQTIYTYTDLTPEEGYYFYRLRMTGKDGSISYSAIQKVNISKKDASIRLFPNPATGQVTITGLANRNSPIRILDSNGKLVSLKVINASDHQVTLSLEGFSKGLYLVTVGNSVQKLLIR